MSLLKNPYILLGISIVLGICGQFLFKHGLNMITSSKPFKVTDIKESVTLVNKFKDGKDPVSGFLKEKFSDHTKKQLETYDGSSEPSEGLQKSIVEDLNRIISGTSIYSQERFAGVELTKPTLNMTKKEHDDKSRFRMNRTLIVETYKGEILKGGIDLSPKIIFIFFTPFIFAGLSCYVLSTFTWLSGLSRIPLSIAYPMLSTGYLIIFIISVLFLGEKYTHAKLVANLLIIAGISLLFWGKQ